MNEVVTLTKKNFEKKIEWIYNVVQKFGTVYLYLWTKKVSKSTKNKNADEMSLREYIASWQIDNPQNSSWLMSSEDFLLELNKLKHAS